MNNIFRMSHSGEGIELDSDGDNILVKKWEPYTEQGSPRLIKQIAKQKYHSFLYESNFDRIKTPEILDEKYLSHKYEVGMKFIDGNDCVDYIAQSDKDELEMLGKSIVDILDLYENKSTYGTVSKDRFMDKFMSTITRCNQTTYEFKEQVISFAETYLDKDSVKIPLGICHGDLTLANLIFWDDKIYVVDFLDNFVETILQDAAKIRQDTNHCWSIHKCRQKGNFSHNEKELREKYSVVDDVIVDYLSQFNWYNEYYHFMQVLNLLRIVPYTESEDTMNYLRSEINKVIAENRMKE